MNQQKKLIQSFETTWWLLEKSADGLSHEDSLAVPQFRANNYNWVVGHMLVSRDRVLSLLGHPGILNAEQTALYDTGSVLVTAETAVRLAALLALFKHSQQEIVQALSEAGEDKLSTIYDVERGQTVLDRIQGLHWHETYHLGQLELLRQVNIERAPFP